MDKQSPSKRALQFALQAAVQSIGVERGGPSSRMIIESVASEAQGNM